MPSKKTSRKVKKRGKPIRIHNLLRHDDLPATVGIVKEVRAELISEIRSVHHELDGKIMQLDGKITQLDGKITQLDGRMTQLDGKFLTQEGKIEKVLSVVHRTQTLMEEQRSENRIVLDGLKSVIERQDRAEEEAKEFRHTIQILVKTHSSASSL